MITRLSRYVIGTLPALVMATLASVGAQAQTMPVIQDPPQHQVVDANGVDLSTGRWTGRLMHLAIGDPKHGGMEWTQTADRMDNLTAILVIGSAPYDIGSYSSYVHGATVYYKGTTPKFIFGVGSALPFTEGGYNVERQNGSSLTCTTSGTIATCTFIAKNGEKVVFGNVPASEVGGGAWSAPPVYHFPTQLIKPNGETWTYNYAAPQQPCGGTSVMCLPAGVFPGVMYYLYGANIWLHLASSVVPLGGNVTGYLPTPISVTNNFGYMIKFNYGGPPTSLIAGGPAVPSVSEVVALNTNVEACNPTALICTFTHNWPKLEYSFQKTATSMSAQWTDNNGNTTTINSTLGGIGNNFVTGSTIVWPSGRQEILTFDSVPNADITGTTPWNSPGTASSIIKASNCHLNLLTGAVGYQSSGWDDSTHREYSPVNCFTQKVTSYSDGQNTWHYNYSYQTVYSSTGPLQPNQYYGIYPNLTTAAVNPLGKTRTVVSFPSGLVSDTNENGQTTSIAALNTIFCTANCYPDYNGRITSITAPAGNMISYAYDPIGSVLSVTYTPVPGVPSGQTSRVASYAYAYSSGSCVPVTCNSIASAIDANGNVSNYTYDPTHGGLTAQTAPADAGGTRPQTRYTYQQFTAQNQGTSVWLPISASTCSVGASCASTANETLTQTGYEPVNLQPTTVTTKAGDNSLFSIKTVGYDAVGNIVASTDPNGNTSYVTFDALRRKIFEISADPDGSGPLPRQMVHHVYDVDGNEIRTEAGTGNAIDGSDFVITKFKRSTFDPATGLLTKTEEVAP